MWRNGQLSHNLLTILTILIVLSTVYRRFSFLRMILAAYVDVSTTEFILASYFSRPISLENPRNLLIRSFFTLQQYCTFHNLPSKIVLYRNYVIMYVHGNQLTWTTYHRTRVGSQSRLMSFSEMGIFSRITSRDENSHETS
jgi:hypothetical protein